MCHRQNTLWHYSCILFETFYCLPLLSWYKTAHGHWPHVNVCRVSCGGVVNMLLVLPITSFIKIYGVVCVQLSHFSIGDWNDLSSAHVIIIIKSEVSNLPIVIIFTMVVCLRSLLYHILLLIAYTFRENRGFVFIIIVQLMMSANNRIRFVLKIIFVC